MATQDFSNHALPELWSLSNRVAVVTGGAKGIGEAIARRLSEAGARVLVVDLDEQGAQATARRIKDQGGTALALRVDLRVSGEVEAAAERAAREWGRLDIWVNDAGIQPLQAGDDLTDDELRDLLDTNLAGVYFGARAAHRHMKAGGRGGVIVNLASSLGFHGVRRQPHYVASKWGVRGLTAALALDWGADGVRVLAVAPGLTDTPGVQAKKEGLDAIAGGDVREVTAKAYPVGRMGVPDDIARGVVFLASDMAAFMTGSTLLVDGGEIAAGGAG